MGHFYLQSSQKVNMSKKVEEQSSASEKAKLLTVVVVLVATLYGYYTITGAHPVLRVLGVLVGFGLAGYILYFTEKGRGWFLAVSHAKKEVMQVVWPTREDTTKMTLLVVVVVILMGIFLWLIDMFFLWGVKLLTGQGG